MNPSSLKTLVLTCSDLQKISQTIGINQLMDRLLVRLETSMQQYDAAAITTPARAGFHYEKPQTGLVEWMPIYQHEAAVTIKVVGYHPQNPATFDLPTIVSTISTYDTATGHLMGVMDGVLPTALRTGAASAIASKYMAKADASRLGLIGCGAQAVTQVHAISRLFPLTEILMYDIDPAAVHSLEKRCEILALDVTFRAMSMEEVVAESDILITATSIDVDAGPLFDQLPTQPHLHVNAIGSDFPGKTEVPLSLLQQSFVCPDFLAQAVIEGECQQLEATDIDTDIISLIQNDSKYTAVKSARSVYDSTGWALQDMVVFNLFVELSQELGIGKQLELESLQGDAANPYHFLRQEKLIEQLVNS